MSGTAPLLVAVAGGTASGKTTLASLFAERLPGTLLIGHDRYYHTVADPTDYDYDVPEALDSELLAEHLDALARGEPVVLPCYDFTLHARLPEGEPAEPRPVVIVEGILVLAEPLIRDRFDLRVWVEAPADIRLLRRIRRDVIERGWSLDEILDRYERMVRPNHERFVAPSRRAADLVLDGLRPPELEVERLLAAVRERLATRGRRSSA